METVDEWRTYLEELPRPESLNLTVTAILEAAADGGSRPLVVRASDGNRYYAKPLQNSHGPVVTVTEFLVARLGLLIGAPVCHVEILEIPEEILPFKHDYEIKAGFANGSREIKGAGSREGLTYRSLDNNAVRHVGVLALYDWCWGDDGQWIYDASDSQRIWSHDHGFYFPPGGQTWTSQELIINVDQPHQLGGDSSGLDPSEIVRIAAVLESLDPKEIGGILKSLPDTWDCVSGDDVATLGWFLFRRAKGVAERMKSLAGSIGGTA